MVPDKMALSTMYNRNHSRIYQIPMEESYNRKLCRFKKTSLHRNFGELKTGGGPVTSPK